MASKERRATRRFLMRLPLTVRWTDESVCRRGGDRIARKVSSRGLYFHLPKGLKSGSPVEIVMTLPHELTQAGAGTGAMPGPDPADESGAIWRSGSGGRDRAVRVHAQPRIGGVGIRF